MEVWSAGWKLRLTTSKHLVRDYRPNKAFVLRYAVGANRYVLVRKELAFRLIQGGNTSSVSGTPCTTVRKALYPSDRYVSNLVRLKNCPKRARTGLHPPHMLCRPHIYCAVKMIKKFVPRDPRRTLAGLHCYRRSLCDGSMDRGS